MSIQWIVQLDSLTFIHWIEIYPMDSAIKLLNSWAGGNNRAKNAQDVKDLNNFIIRSSIFVAIHTVNFS